MPVVIQLYCNACEMWLLLWKLLHDLDYYKDLLPVIFVTSTFARCEIIFSWSACTFLFSNDEQNFIYLEESGSDFTNSCAGDLYTVGRARTQQCDVIKKRLMLLCSSAFLFVPYSFPCLFSFVPVYLSFFFRGEGVGGVVHKISVHLNYLHAVCRLDLDFCLLRNISVMFIHSLLCYHNSAVGIVKW